MTQYLLRIFIIVVIICSAHTAGLALTNEQIFSQFRFNFITPGARATAMGGAFIGLADDATAVESNPAGLTILTAPEISAEWKHIMYTAEQIYANPVTPESYNDETGVIETDVTRMEFDDIAESVPFVSIVYPYKRIAFSVYRQELVNYKSSFRTSSEAIMIPGTRRGFYPMDAAVELSVTNYGLGIAIEPLDGLSLAVSPRWSKLKMKAHTDTFGLNTFPVYPTDFSDDDIIRHDEIDGEDFGASVNAGILWKPHPRISLGAVYKSGPTFTVTETSFSREFVDRVGRGLGFGDETEFTVKVPDSYGAGIAFQATDSLTFTCDVTHIRYIDLLKDFDIGTTGSTQDNYTVDNVTEVHIGVEYILALGERLLALRMGMYTDLDHTIRFTGTTGDEVSDTIGDVKYPGGEDQIHITGGVGLVVNEHFQIDTAANIADKHKQLCLSGVYRF